MYMDKRFQGKMCPFCKTLFKENDTIVVCSTCEMPHHLSCWQENNGCTTFGCAGSIMETIGPEKTDNKGVQESVQPSDISKTDSLARRYETLFESEPNTIPSEIPVLIEKLSLIVDHQSESLMARCIFRSLTDKPIMAMLVDVLCTDVWGNQTESVEGFQFLDLKTKRETTFGQTKPIPIPDQATRTIEVVIKKLLYSDRTMADASRDVSILPKQDTLESFFGNVELAKEYARESTERAKFTTIAGDSYWRCACGAINRTEESTCHRCNSNKEHLLSLLDRDLITENLKAYQVEKRLQAEREQAEREEQLRQAEERMRIAQEEKEREEKEEAERKAEDLRQRKAKRKKIVKRTSLIVLAILFFGFLVYTTGWHIIPYIRYQNACKALEAQSFDEAYDTFVALDTFSDSSERAIDTVYQKGSHLMNNGLYLEAATEFERIPDYQDSSTQAVYCRNEAAYLDAEALFDSGDYKGAADAFTTLSTYADSADRANASNYLYAQELVENGEYEDAHTIFTSLSGYENSNTLAEESYYRLASQLFDEKQYDEAYHYFDGLEDYGDSKARADESEYLFAVEQFEAENYEEAVAAFELVNDYEDAATRLLEAKYQYALELTEKEEWKEASDYYKELGDYLDSDSRYQETYYQYGLKMLDDENFKTAVTVFKALNGYQDSESKIHEAQYSYVVENKNNTDTTTYSYLKDLKSIGYEDSSDIYNSLYEWKVINIHFSTKESGTPTKTSISRYDPVYCHFELSGGPPGQSIYVYNIAVFPDGHADEKTKTNFKYRRNDTGWFGWESGIYTTPMYGTTGTLTMKFYDEDDNLIGEASVQITY